MSPLYFALPKLKCFHFTCIMYVLCISDYRDKPKFGGKNTLKKRCMWVDHFSFCFVHRISSTLSGMPSVHIRAASETTGIVEACTIFDSVVLSIALLIYWGGGQGTLHNHTIIGDVVSDSWVPSRSHPWCHASCLVLRLLLGLYWPCSELSAVLYMLRTMTMPTANLSEIPCCFSIYLKIQLPDFSRNGLCIQLLH